MHRRQFLKIASQIALATGAGFPVCSELFAATDNYTGPLWIIVNAYGGWDVTSLCDPKGYHGPSDVQNPARLNNYDKANILQTGNLFIAPPPDSFLPDEVNYDASLYHAQTFFEKYHQQLLIINGIDYQTNSHNDGQLHSFAGRLRKGYPSFAALVAAALAPNRALAFITNGGYSNAAGLMTPTRMNTSAIKALFEIGYPNRSANPKSAKSPLYLPTDVIQLIEQASAEQHQALLSQQTLPRVRQAIEQFSNSRRSIHQLNGLADDLASTPTMPESQFNGRKKAYQMYLQGRIALAGYQQGVTCSANIRLTGFDTHTQHDKRHQPLLMDLLQGIDAIIEEAKMRQLNNNLVLVILSDFGRTNKYNKESGKDHWPIGSAMLLGNSQQTITGNRIIGATTANHKAIAIDPLSLTADVDNSNARAIRLTPAHLHRALRRLAGIENSPMALAYPLTGEDLPLFESF